MDKKTNALKLIFVYNADSGHWNALLDSLHKTFSPSTYNCQLCAITYGKVGMKKEWKAFLEKLPIATSFLHKDEWLKQTDRNDTLPAVFIEKDGRLSPFIEAEILTSCTLEALQANILERLEQKNITV